jgi:hypothetical protein
MLGMPGESRAFFINNLVQRDINAYRDFFKEEGLFDQP